MAVTALIAHAASRPPLLMAALGLLSGVLSAWIGFAFEPHWLGPVGGAFFLDAGMVPIGALFAAAVGVGLAIATQRAVVLPVAAVATMYAWSAAVHAATNIITDSSDDVRLIVGSLVAGAVGAALTHAGGALVLGTLRRFSSLAVTTAVGAALGLLYYAGERNWLDGRLLFVLWQPATAYAIGAGLAKRLRR
jgi:hypothetical protein